MQSKSSTKRIIDWCFAEKVDFAVRKKSQTVGEEDVSHGAFAKRSHEGRWASCWF
jgi:hypothetical protein